MQIVYADVRSLRELDVNIERPGATAADLVPLQNAPGAVTCELAR
jgi:hypothetical protein